MTEASAARGVRPRRGHEEKPILLPRHRVALQPVRYVRHGLTVGPVHTNNRVLGFFCIGSQRMPRQKCVGLLIALLCAGCDVGENKCCGAKQPG